MVLLLLSIQLKRLAIKPYMLALKQRKPRKEIAKR